MRQETLVVTLPSHSFNPDWTPTTAKTGRSHPRPQISSPRRQHVVFDENHLGHPRLARMMGQAWDLPRAGFAVTDLAVIAINLLFVSYVKAALTWLPKSDLAQRPYRTTTSEFLAVLMLYSTLTLLCCRTFGLYDTREAHALIERGWSLLKAMVLSTGVLASFASVSHVGAVSPLTIGCAGVL